MALACVDDLCGYVVYVCVCVCVCVAQPGSFTQAVVRGLWVVIEDVDAAPPEILAALAPLLHHRRLLLPGSGVTLHAAPGFQLIGTVTTDGHGGGGTRGAMGALAGAWARLVVAPPAPHELLQVLRVMHPSAHAAGVAALVRATRLVSLSLLLHCQPLDSLCFAARGVRTAVRAAFPSCTNKHTLRVCTLSVQMCLSGSRLCFEPRTVEPCAHST